MNEYTAQLSDCTGIASFGTGDWGHAAIYCVLCMGIPHCQHSAAPTVAQLHSDFSFLCIQNSTVMFLFYCGTAAGR